MPTYQCYYCTKNFEGKDTEDPDLKEMLDGLRHFCSDDCVCAEFERQAKAVDAYKDLTEQFPGTIQ